LGGAKVELTTQIIVIIKNMFRRKILLDRTGPSKDQAEHSFDHHYRAAQQIDQKIFSSG
jgi:hypothetical protein